MSLNRLVAVVFVSALCLAADVQAEPAVVKVFEAKVHAEPDTRSPVLHTFIEKAEVSVSEEATNGWRRVRLPDQNTGWIQESALLLGSAPAPTPVPTPTPAPAVPLESDRPVRAEQAPLASPVAKIYVKDLDHLAELVKEDPVVGPQARNLETRHTAALVTGIGGTLVGLGLFTLGITSKTETCDPPLFPGADPFCTTSPNTALMGAGLAVPLASLLATWIIMPGGDDLLDLINTWNSRHPDQPFDLPDQVRRE